MMAKKNSGLSEKDKAAIENAVRSSVSSAPKIVARPKDRPSRSKKESVESKSLRASKREAEDMAILDMKSGGGKVTKMAKGGMCRGGGAATRGKAYNGSY